MTNLHELKKSGIIERIIRGYNRTMQNIPSLMGEVKEGVSPYTPTHQSNPYPIMWVGRIGGGGRFTDDIGYYNIICRIRVEDWGDDFSPELDVTWSCKLFQFKGRKEIIKEAKEFPSLRATLAALEKGLNSMDV